MEHHKLNTHAYSIRAIWIIIAIFTLTGCNRPETNPEFLDPIYTKLLGEMRAYEKVAEESGKKIESLEKELASTQSRTLERKNVKKDIDKELLKIKKATQMVEYLKIRASRRKFYDKKNYLAAFEKKESWPPKEEIEAYETNKRLQQASRNWDDRVPRSKLQQNKFDLASDSVEKSKNESDKK